MLITLACAPGDPGPGERFSPAPYLDDLAQLERHTATAYANFEWALTEGGVDPVALDERTRRAILEASTDREARQALGAFVDAFGDGHFRLLPERPVETASGPAAKAPGRGSSGEGACAALGYRDHDQSLRVELGEGFHLLTAPDDPFPAGWLDTESGARLGLVRIDEFGAERYGEYCPEEWVAYRRELEGTCADWPCTYGFRLRMEDRLLNEIARRVEALGERRIDGLVVDITGNGGGTDWVDPAARLLTAKTLSGNDLSGVRHPHWRDKLEEMAAEVASDLARSELSADQRAVLEQVKIRLDAGIAAAEAPCDLSGVWQSGAADGLPCSPMVRGTLFTTGLLASPPVIEVDGLTIGTGLFKALAHPKRSPVWQGPLAVLIDHDTASAAELFAVLLRDNDAAIVMGERSAGVGCDYTNGGIQVVLTHSRLEVWAPDCVRHRRDGGNERAGLTPDLPSGRPDEETTGGRGAALLRAFATWGETIAARSQTGPRGIGPRPTRASNSSGGRGRANR